MNGLRISSATAGDRLLRLEYLRGAAASYVFFHHFVRTNFPGNDRIVAFFPFGQAAVLVFFLLSGFVIHYATLAPHPDQAFRTYFRRRARRIFPIFIAALVITYLASSYYRREWAPLRGHELVLNLLQLQDRARPGNWAAPYLGNAPLWSLSYEWWFYMLYFPLERGFAARPEWRQAAVLAVSLLGFAVDLAWPNPFAHVASYFVIWWFGVEVAREYSSEGRVTLRRQAFALASITLILACWGAVTVYQRAFNWGEHPGITVRHFVTAWILILVGWLWYRVGLRGFDFLLAPFRHVAGFSYALYVMHLPLLWLARDVGGKGVIALLWVPPVVFACCWCVESLLAPTSGLRPVVAAPRAEGCQN